ncbi:MAG: hypothetical protein KBS43_02385 [Oscillospiraceae bacterium]|nr:hypothetical protein [Candidatus Limimonas coprohippi]
MIEFSEKLELEKGISNLFIAAGATAITKRIASEEAKRPELKRLWVIELVCLSLAAFIGSLIHSFKWNQKTSGIIWGILYAIEFETVRRFHKIISMFDEGYKIKKSQLSFLMILEIALYIPATLIRFFTGKNTFTFFISYASVVAVLIGKLIKEEKSTPATKDLGISVATLIFAVLSQITIKNYGATVAHIFIILALLPLKNSAIKSFE